MADAYGISGFGQPGGEPDFQAQLDIPIIGFGCVFKWALFETAEGVYDYDYLDSVIQRIVDAGIYVSFKVWVAAPVLESDPNQVTPPYLFTNGVEKVFMTTTNYLYPNYKNTYYQTRFQALLDTIIEHIGSYSQDILDKLTYFQLSIGSTGDRVLFHGVPSNPAYDFTETEENTYFRSWYVSTYENLLATAPTVTLVINVGNDGVDVDYCDENTPNCGVKEGDFSHTYSFAGEGNYAIRSKGYRIQGRLTRGEAADPAWGTVWWLESIGQNTFALMCSALHSNLNILNIPYGIIEAEAQENSLYNFFSDYANNILHPAKGFCQLRDQIDLADTTRFPEADFGNVINPAQQNAYNNAYNSIMASNDSEAQKQTQITKITISFLNPDRVTSIRAFFPYASYQPVERGRDGDSYNNDYIVDGIPDNYYNYITQYSPNTTSVGRWRVGDTGQIYGRYCRIPDDEMFFTIDAVLVSEGSWTLTIDVVFYDEGTDTWDLWYDNGTGRVSAGTITKTNTLDFIKQSFTIDNFNGGGLLENNCDFSITGNTTKFTLLEVSDITNNDMALTPNFTATQSIGLPSVVILTDTSTGSDGAITQRRAFLQTASATYLVPTGTTTNYVQWAYSAPSIQIDALPQDEALYVTVQWLNVSNAVLYTKTYLYAFTLNQMQFLLNLSLAQVSSGLTVQNIASSGNYFSSKIQLISEIESANNAVEIGNNIYAAQAAIDRGTYLINNPNLFY